MRKTKQMKRLHFVIEIIFKSSKPCHERDFFICLSPFSNQAKLTTYTIPHCDLFFLKKADYSIPFPAK